MLRRFQFLLVTDLLKRQAPTFCNPRPTWDCKLLVRVGIAVRG